MLLRSYFFLLIMLLAVGSAAAQNEAPPVPQPKLISAPTPVYPKEAMDAGIGGKVTVRVVVDEQGKIVSVDDPTGPGRLCNFGNSDARVVALRQAVIDAIKQAKFEPAMKDGKAVKSVTYVSSTFTATDDSKITSVGMVVRHATRLPKPAYPGAARAARAGGAVTVKLVIDEKGNPVTAEAVSGHPLLRGAATEAACDARFKPLKKDDVPVMMSGIVVYNFAPY